MGFEYLTNVSLAQARKEYLERLVSGGFGSKAETIPVFESCGRVTAKAVYAHICAPHYAASAMDGVAVSAKETFGATETTPVTLNSGPVSCAGHRRPDSGGQRCSHHGGGHCEEWRWFHHHSRSRSPVAAYPPDRRGCMRRGNDFAQPYDRFPGCHWCDDCRRCAGN